MSDIAVKGTAIDKMCNRRACPLSCHVWDVFLSFLEQGVETVGCRGKLGSQIRFGDPSGKKKPSAHPPRIAMHKQRSQTSVRTKKTKQEMKAKKIVGRCSMAGRRGGKGKFDGISSN